MGILNLTPDSFYQGDIHLSEKEILKKIEGYLEHGMTILDAGAFSTRPGAKNVSIKDELERLTPSLLAIRKEFPKLILSIDSFRSEVIRECHEKFGVDIINDVSSGKFDNKLLETVADLKLTYVLTHIQGSPENMQDKPTYSNVVKEVIFEMNNKIKLIRSIGVEDIIVDPGFGFGKTLEHNYQLLNSTQTIKRSLQKPILIGVSRKSMIFKLLKNNPKESLTGTIAANTVALLNEADILRVHDVQAAKECIEIVDFYKKN